MANGLAEETVVEHFQKYGIIDQILLVPGKSCAFLSYTDEKSAIDAYEKCNGKLNIAQDERPVYLSYVESLALIQEDKSWNVFPEGLIILEDYITEQQEQELLNLCSFDSNTSSMRHRQVQHFGYEFRYDINNVDKNKPLETDVPDCCNFLWDKLKSTDLHCKNFHPDQLTVNHYLPGQGIPHHVDTHSAFEDPIMSLSLNSSVIIDFKSNSKHYCVLLPRRSLAIMSGESRYNWTHGITPRKYDIIKTENGFNTQTRQTRVSFTFRKVLQGECSCIYHEKCDSYIKSQIKEDLEENIASQLEKTHVYDVYENIASHFSDTRHKPWPNVLEFVQSLDYGSVLVDIGCGNGKYLGHNKKIFEVRFIFFRKYCKKICNM